MSNRRTRILDPSEINNNINGFNLMPCTPDTVLQRIYLSVPNISYGFLASLCTYFYGRESEGYVEIEESPRHIAEAQSPLRFRAHSVDGSGAESGVVRSIISGSEMFFPLYGEGCQPAMFVVCADVSGACMTGDVYLRERLIVPIPLLVDTDRTEWISAIIDDSYDGYALPYSLLGMAIALVDQEADVLQQSIAYATIREAASRAAIGIDSDALIAHNAWVDTGDDGLADYGRLAGADQNYLEVINGGPVPPKNIFAMPAVLFLGERGGRKRLYYNQRVSAATIGSLTITGWDTPPKVVRTIGLVGMSCDTSFSTLPDLSGISNCPIQAMSHTELASSLSGGGIASSAFFSLFCGIRGARYFYPDGLFTSIAPRCVIDEVEQVVNASLELITVRPPQVTAAEILHLEVDGVDRYFVPFSWAYVLPYAFFSTTTSGYHVLPSPSAENAGRLTIGSLMYDGDDYLGNGFVHLLYATDLLIGAIECARESFPYLAVDEVDTAADTYSCFGYYTPDAAHLSANDFTVVAEGNSYANEYASGSYLEGMVDDDLVFVTDDSLWTPLAPACSPNGDIGPSADYTMDDNGQAYCRALTSLQIDAEELDRVLVRLAPKTGRFHALAAVATTGAVLRPDSELLAEEYRETPQLVTATNGITARDITATTPDLMHTPIRVVTTRGSRDNDALISGDQLRAGIGANAPLSVDDATDALRTLATAGFALMARLAGSFAGVLMVVDLDGRPLYPVPPFDLPDPDGSSFAASFIEAAMSGSDDPFSLADYADSSTKVFTGIAGISEGSVNALYDGTLVSLTEWVCRIVDSLSSLKIELLAHVDDGTAYTRFLVMDRTGELQYLYVPASYTADGITVPVQNRGLWYYNLRKAYLAYISVVDLAVALFSRFALIASALVSRTAEPFLGSAEPEPVPLSLYLFRNGDSPVYPILEEDIPDADVLFIGNYLNMVTQAFPDESLSYDIAMTIDTTSLGEDETLDPVIMPGIGIIENQTKEALGLDSKDSIIYEGAADEYYAYIANSGHGTCGGLSTKEEIHTYVENTLLEPLKSVVGEIDAVVRDGANLKFIDDDHTVQSVAASSFQGVLDDNKGGLGAMPRVTVRGKIDATYIFPYLNTIRQDHEFSIDVSVQYRNAIPHRSATPGGLLTPENAAFANVTRYESLFVDARNAWTKTVDAAANLRTLFTDPHFIRLVINTPNLFIPVISTASPVFNTTTQGESFLIKYARSQIKGGSLDDLTIGSDVNVLDDTGINYNLRLSHRRSIATLSAVLRRMGITSSNDNEVLASERSNVEVDGTRYKISLETSTTVITRDSPSMAVEIFKCYGVGSLFSQFIPNQFRSTNQEVARQRITKIVVPRRQGCTGVTVDFSAEPPFTGMGGSVTLPFAGDPTSVVLPSGGNGNILVPGKNGDIANDAMIAKFCNARIGDGLDTVPAAITPAEVREYRTSVDGEQTLRTTLTTALMTNSLWNTSFNVHSVYPAQSPSLYRVYLIIEPITT